MGMRGCLSLLALAHDAICIGAALCTRLVKLDGPVLKYASYTGVGECASVVIGFAKYRLMFSNSVTDNKARSGQLDAIRMVGQETVKFNGPLLSLVGRSLTSKWS